jgi:hypothetical protein
LQAWTHTHLSIWFGHEKKSEIETHPPKAGSLWYRVGRKTTFFFFASKAKGLSNRQVSVQQLKGLFFSSCCLKKGRCRRRDAAAATDAAAVATVTDAAAATDA